MSHPNVRIVSFEIPVDNPEKMDQFQKAMDEWHDATEKYIMELSKELNCSIDCAQDVWYLRSRSRWSEENEKELIRLHSIGQRPNIFEWP